MAVIAAGVITSCGSHDGSTTKTDPPGRCPPRRPPVETTLQDIMAGRFPSARNKNGKCGVRVTVRNLRVLRVTPEADGDWHVEVTDGTVPIFITELVPKDQIRERRPPVGKRIDETGTVYYDRDKDVPHHQYTPWEIHPIDSWALSASQRSS